MSSHAYWDLRWAWILYNLNEFQVFRDNELPMDKKMRKSEFARVCKTIWAVAFIVLITGLLKPDQASAQERVHSVFFEGTDSELHVYRIHGKETGKTLILIGGIQGDEIGRAHV